MIMIIRSVPSLIPVIIVVACYDFCYCKGQREESQLDGQKLGSGPDKRLQPQVCGHRCASGRKRSGIPSHHSLASNYITEDTTDVQQSQASMEQVE